MTEDIVVVGAGGFGRETLDVIEAINAASTAPIWRVVGVVDDGPAEIQLERISARGYQYLGRTEAALEHFSSVTFTIGIGSPGSRAKLAAKFEGAGWTPATLVHPAAVVGSKSVIEKGAVVCGGVQLSTNTRLGRYVHVNPGAIIGHDSTVEDFVSINPGAIVSGEVHIRPGALIGAGAVILQGLEIGAGAVIGANGCLTRNADEGTVLKGVPAR
jgi:sugar O-acyltransferase (sialic acid O-acetyltransferase NeuD family)